MGAGLLAPGIGERAGVQAVEAKLVPEFQHDRLGDRVVAGDRDNGTPGSSGRLAKAGQACRADGVERLDHRGGVAVFVLVRGRVEDGARSCLAAGAHITTWPARLRPQ